MVKYPSLLSNLFSSSFIDKIIKGNHDCYLNTILKESNFKSRSRKYYTLGNTLSDVFKYLNENYRCEYIYKTAILKELLLKNHNLSNSVYLTEFRAFTAKADIVILNGTSTAYEIKSDVDNLSRLVNQVGIYQKMFDRVYVVSNAGNVGKINAIIPKQVGIAVLQSDSSIRFQRRSASHLKYLDKSLMFDALRKPEYLSIIEDIFGNKVDVPPTLAHSHCKKKFITLNNETAHKYYLRALKNRKFRDTQVQLIDNVHLSLKALLTDRRYSENECKIISFALNQNATSHVSTLSKSKAT